MCGMSPTGPPFDPNQHLNSVLFIRQRSPPITGQIAQPLPHPLPPAHPALPLLHPFRLTALVAPSPIVMATMFPLLGESRRREGAHLFAKGIREGMTDEERAEDGAYVFRGRLMIGGQTDMISGRDALKRHVEFTLYHCISLFLIASHCSL